MAGNDPTFTPRLRPWRVFRSNCPGVRHRPSATSNKQWAYRSLHGRQPLNSGLNESPPVKSLTRVGVALLAAAPAFAQSGAMRPPSGTIVTQEPNSTGNDRDVVVSRGATGADTATSDSAAGGNANKPEQAVPNGSAGGGSGGSN